MKTRKEEIAGMKYPSGGFISAVGFLSLAAQVNLPPVNDGSPHGDPPYLLEKGWTPLLNGKDLEGWRFENPDRGAWRA